MREGFELKLSALENENAHLRQQLSDAQSRITQHIATEQHTKDLLDAERLKNAQLWDQLRRASAAASDVTQLKSELQLQKDKLKRQEEENARLSRLYRQAKALNVELDSKNAELDRENRRMLEAAHYNEIVAQRVQETNIDLRQRLAGER